MNGITSVESRNAPITANAPSSSPGGALVNWYPYWFIDPSRAGGWGGVVVFALAISVGFLVVSLAMLWLGNKLKRQVDY